VFQGLTMTVILFCGQRNRPKRAMRKTQEWAWECWWRSREIAARGGVGEVSLRRWEDVIIARRHGLGDLGLEDYVNQERLSFSKPRLLNLSPQIHRFHQSRQNLRKAQRNHVVCFS
jgi:hypothetical protein